MSAKKSRNIIKKYIERFKQGYKSDNLFYKFCATLCLLTVLGSILLIVMNVATYGLSMVTLCNLIKIMLMVSTSYIVLVSITDEINRSILYILVLLQFIMSFV